ncbi:MAG TPA: hypothetical protein VMJ10_17315 [Kofleriaceae bacterium]|nr:hypothetical protein [Kofleriaceae bacterium]
MNLARGARIAAIVVGVASCRQLLGLDTPTVGGASAGDAMIDTPTTCEGSGTSCLDASTLLTCTTPGMAGTLTPCAWGCNQGAPAAACFELVPAGGGALPSDVLTDTTLADVTLGNGTTINTTFGSITGVTSGFTYVMRGNVAVFRFGKLTVNGTIRVIGNYPAAFVADGDITIAGTMDAGCAIGIPGAGGFFGGMQGVDGSGSGGGMRGAGDDGAGGGGYGGTGGIGGASSANVASGGMAFGDPTITTLLGGGGGGGAMITGGGAGGGAIQLASNGTIAIAAGGGIGAGGCGAPGKHNGGAGGGGGGAGGTILLEAPTVSILGALAVNGGGGASGGMLEDSGSDGTLDRNQALGGAGGGTGGAGGAGAAGAIANGSGGATAQLSGGGGGGIGRIRINTRGGSGLTIDTDAVMSPTLDDPQSTATSGSATVQ